MHRHPGTGGPVPARAPAALTERFDPERLVTTFALDRAGDALAQVADGAVMKAVFAA